MMKKVKQGEGAVGTREEFPQELFATFDGAGEDRYCNAAIGPVENHLRLEAPFEFVATYKLVRVQKMRLKQTRSVVKAK